MSPGPLLGKGVNESCLIRLAIRSSGGRWSDDPEERRRPMLISVSWEFTRYAERPYIELPLMTSGSIALPDAVAVDDDSARYLLRFLTNSRIASAETVLYVRRADLDAAIGGARR